MQSILSCPGAPALSGGRDPVLHTAVPLDRPDDGRGPRHAARDGDDVMHAGGSDRGVRAGAMAKDKPMKRFIGAILAVILSSVAVVSAQAQTHTAPPHLWC